jgi:hypothetical protein
MTTKDEALALAMYTLEELRNNSVLKYEHTFVDTAITAIKQAQQTKEPSFPLISLGYGRIEVAEGHHEGTHALIFGKNGTGQMGAPTQPKREHKPSETLAVVTFANVESLDVVAEKLRVLRQKITGAEQAQEPVIDWTHFDNAYSKACKSSQPDDWMEAALAAQQVRFAAPKQAEK